MARVNIDILRVRELKWKVMEEFNSDNHHIYYCGQKSLRRNGVALIVNKGVLRGGKEISLLGRVSRCMNAQLYLTLCDPVDCSPPDSSVHGILQARILEWIAIPVSRGSLWLKNQTCISCLSCTGKSATALERATKWACKGHEYREELRLCDFLCHIEIIGIPTLC